MQVELNLGDAGYQFIDIDTDDLSEVNASDLHELFKKMKKEEQDKFSNFINYSEFDDEKTIRVILQRFDTDTAHKIVKKLAEEFLSLEQVQKKLAQINKG